MLQRDANELVTGGPGTLMIGDATYLVSQPSEADIRTLKHHLRKHATTPLQAIRDELQHMDPMTRAETLRIAVEMQSRPRDLTPDTIVDLLLNPDNAAFLVWLLVRENHPDATQATIRSGIIDSNVVQLLADLYEACGLAAVIAGKATGRSG